MCLMKVPVEQGSIAGPRPRSSDYLFLLTFRRETVLPISVFCFTSSEQLYGAMLNTISDLHSEALHHQCAHPKVQGRPSYVKRLVYTCMQLYMYTWVYICTGVCIYGYCIRFYIVLFIPLARLNMPLGGPTAFFL